MPCDLEVQLHHATRHQSATTELQEVDRRGYHSSIVFTKFVFSMLDSIDVFMYSFGNPFGGDPCAARPERAGGLLATEVRFRNTDTNRIFRMIEPSSNSMLHDTVM